MKQQIIEILLQHPGLRKKEIASYLRCHRFPALIITLYEMEDDGLIRSESCRDKYYATPEGEKYLLLFSLDK